MEELQKNSRRTFIRQISGGAAFLSIGGSPFNAFAKRDGVRITILHTNDMHSRIEPFPSDDLRYANQGGMARRSAIISKIRSEENNVLLLDAGDIFQGTPYFNYFGGELEYKLMSDMGYDAVTIGNHDFDNGVEGLAKQFLHAKFPFLIANYDFKDTPMAGKTQPYKIFEKSGIRIGVFGIGIELNGLVEKKMYGNTIFLDPISIANDTAALLKKEQKCDLVICLSHLGYKYNEKKLSDEIFAAQTENINLIIGGHTHTFLDHPISYKNKSGKEVLINQVGWAGIRIGRIDFTFRPKGPFSSIENTFDVTTSSCVLKVLTKSIG